MFALRRYAVFAGVAACLLLLITYYRQPIIDRTAFGTSSPPLIRPYVLSNRPKLTDPNFSWSQVPERYPVQDVTPLPTDQPKQLPKVQYDFSSRSELVTLKNERSKRQAAVKKSFERGWKAYKSHAWLHDELAPISGAAKDGFGGWAASLVDNLDNLWIMGMKDEFEEAVKAAVQIDLRKCTLEQINVFETTIRHLGGLLSAYDLSGDERLLWKAKEFGDMLMVAFDTPNRLPITRWFWGKSLREPQIADDRVLVAEIGSLSMEFTHLSMLTRNPRYYDAVDRITQLFVDQQSKTYLPGMWPVTVNAQIEDFASDSLFTLSAMSDSLYEYFPKMHALLGGIDPRYEKLFSGSMTTAIEQLLFRPMLPKNDDVLLSGQVRKQGREEAGVLDPQGQHLVCFAGGMFALGGKLFSNEDWLTVGKKLVDGCIYTYKAMPLGIMPEVFRMIPCESRMECTWNETLWKDVVTAQRGDDGTDADYVIEKSRLPPGFIELKDRRYILRPEAIESVFILYRITGEQKYQEAAWEMFEAISSTTETELANAALRDISYSKAQVGAMRGKGESIQVDSMESFWMAETLKYFYLIFSEPDLINLDEWVFNTEAHPFKRRLPD